MFEPQKENYTTTEVRKLPLFMSSFRGKDAFKTNPKASMGGKPEQDFLSHDQPSASCTHQHIHPTAKKVVMESPRG